MRRSASAERRFLVPGKQDPPLRILHLAIQGNIPPVDVIRLGTPQDVLRSGRECIRKAWDSPNGFTLTSGCQTPMDTPAENLQALMDAARIFGRYPINQELLNSED